MAGFVASYRRRAFDSIHRELAYKLQHVNVIVRPSLQCFDAVGWAAGRASGL